MTQFLTDLPAGHSFEAVSFTIDRGRSHAYRTATGDGLAVYDELGVVPPLAVAALALGELLKAVALPPGTLHANESVRAHAAVPIGSALVCNARVAQRSTRGGWTVSVLDSEITREGALAMTARATVLSPGGGT